VQLWQQAGFPSVPRLLGAVVNPLPKQPAWRSGEFVHSDITDGVTLDILNWLPAAKFERRCTVAEGHPPAVELHITGNTPMGMPVDENAWVHASEGNGSITQLFGGVIEASLWRARSPQEENDFLHPPAVKDLPPLGRIVLLSSGSAPATNITVVGPEKNPSPIPGSNYQMRIAEYFPQAIVKDDHMVKSGDEPTDPIVHVELTSAAGNMWDYFLSAKYPFFSTSSLVTRSPKIIEQPPVLLYQHPAALVTNRQGQRGRLQLLQTTDQRLLARRLGLNGPEETYQVRVGEEHDAWMGLKVTVVQHVPMAELSDDYRPLHVSASKIDQSMRAMRVALTVDGQRTETWLARGAGPKNIETPRGPATLSYGFDNYELPVTLSLVSAEMQKDPGAQTAASYSSVVSVDESGTNERISMNQPLTTAGFTFYQSGFDDSLPGGSVSTLSVRRDPGWILKYTGCALIVGGIFLMFYMRAYFQKTQERKAGQSVLAPTQSAALALAATNY
jgi:hypothetical protein